MAYLTSDLGTKKKVTIGNPSRALEKRAGLLIFWLQYARRGEQRSVDDDLHDNNLGASMQTLHHEMNGILSIKLRTSSQIIYTEDPSRSLPFYN